ncbi:hypothetical protein HA402_011017 [Bradysia odoriphaga]|nr:hypothetical protein HA402_011017 [Bradysia odoriphaga]
MTTSFKVKREPGTRQFILINEENLIKEVRKRPILYDKSLKGYRKPSSREQSWREVAYALNCTPEESKKRWRSLRDAFMKQCKQNANDDMYGNPKKKKWLFYDLMKFLSPYLDATVSPDDSYKMEVQYVEEYEQTDETNFYKEGDCKFPSYIKSEQKQAPDEANDDSISNDPDEIIEQDAEEQESYELYERTDGGEVFAGPIVINQSDTEHESTNSQIQFVYCNEKEPKPPTPRKAEAAQVRYSITDPDERFLLSCAPILKRLSQKKNSLARVKVQELLYQIEFGDT